MRQQLGVLGFLLLAGVLHSVPVAAQALGSTGELHFYGGELWSDALTHQPISGQTPELADHLTYGARYDQNFTDVWGLELAAGQTLTHTTHVASSADLRLRTADLDVTWNFSPHSALVGYTLMGVGYANSHLEHLLPASGLAAGPESPDERRAVTGNLGIGARWYLARHLIVRLEARYRYISRLVGTDDRYFNTVETTAGIGWRF
jgi:outer membrane beta-barrel protein